MLKLRCYLFIYLLLLCALLQGKDGRPGQPGEAGPKVGGYCY